MSFTGGSATLYGVLFQLLGSARWACEFSFEDCCVENEDIQSVRLILEPQSGGDLSVESPQTRIVEQWKSRRTKRAWTIRDIITDVLPDLYLATASQDFGKPIIFRLCAQGKISDWEHAKLFFQKFRGLRQSQFDIGDLNGTSTIPFMGGKTGTLTERGFFDWIAKSIQESQLRRKINESQDTRHERICFLLANFEIQCVGSAADLALKIDEWLRPRIDCADPDHLAAKRQAMCGKLLECGSSGHAKINPRDFLNSLGLTGIPLTQWSLILADLSRAATKAAMTMLHYQVKHDVRRVPVWPHTKPVLLLTGHGGCGKSWQLASLISTCESTGVVLFRATGDVQQDLESAARIVWQDVSGHESPLDLNAIGKRLRSCVPETKRPWLTILIDDLKSGDELSRLIEQPWKEWGIRIAMTVPFDLGAQFEQQSRSDVKVVPVGEFSESQLRTYVIRWGNDWSSIPADVRELLRVPLLARIYCELDFAPSWKPKSEYDILQKFWNRLATHPLQADHQDDQAKLRHLAGYLQQSKPYPWSFGDCKNAGLDSADITRLARIGWLNRENSRIVFWHNRLLNWAFAEHLADRLRFEGPHAVDEVCDVLRDAIGHDQHLGGQLLGYVFMDLLWSILHDNHPVGTDAYRIIRGIEQAMAPDGFPRTLYRHLLPTLGDCVGEAIADRLEHASLPGDRFLPELAANALTRIGTSASSSTAVSLLGSTNRLAQEVGMRVLQHLPVESAIDPLWNAYKPVDENTEATDTDDERNSERLIACQAAIRACAPTSSTWLRRTIHEGNLSPRRARLLAEILAGSEFDDASHIWEASRERLREILGKGVAPLAWCISRFRDVRYVELMVQWATSGNHLAMLPGFETLCRIAPERALGILPDVDAAVLGLGWRNWFDELFAANPGETQRRVKEIMRRSPCDAADLGNAYFSRSWRVDDEGLVIFFDATVRLLEIEERGELKDSLVLRKALALLGRLGTLKQEVAFSHPSARVLESELADHACRWIEEGCHHIYVDQVIPALLHFEGAGFTSCINAILIHGSQISRLQGIKWATVRADDETIRTLEEITKSDDVSQRSTPKSPVLQLTAVEALAALGADAEFVPALLRHSGDIDTIRVLREGLQPISDAHLMPAMCAIESPETEDRKRGFFAIGLSGRIDLIPLIHARLAQKNLDIEERFGCLWALYGLNADDDTAIAHFRWSLTEKRCRHVGLSGLLQSKRNDVIPDLVAEMNSIDPYKFWGLDSRLPVILAENPNTRPAAAQFAWNSQISSRSPFCDLNLLELLGDLKSPGVSDYVMNEAQASESSMNVVGRRRAAIRALAKHDPEAAFDSGVAALQHGRHDRHFYADTLMEIDCDRAVPILCRQLENEGNSRVARSIYVALRQRARLELVEVEVDRLLSGNVRQRIIAIEIIRWMGQWFLDERLVSLLETEEHGAVRRTIHSAAAFHELEHVGKDLLDRLKKSTGQESWSLCETLFVHFPPESLGSRLDPLWIGPACESLEPILLHHVNERFQVAIKELDDSIRSSGGD